MLCRRGGVSIAFGSALIGVRSARRTARLRPVSIAFGSALIGVNPEPALCRLAFVSIAFGSALIGVLDGDYPTLDAASQSPLVRL